MGAVTQEMFYTLRAYGLWLNKVGHVGRNDDNEEGVEIIQVYLSKAPLAAWQVFPGFKFRTVSERHSVLVTDAGLEAVHRLRGLFWTWLGGTTTTPLPPFPTSDMTNTRARYGLHPTRGCRVATHPTPRPFPPTLLQSPN